MTVVLKTAEGVLSGLSLSLHLQTLLLLEISREVLVDLGPVTVHLQICIATCLAHCLLFLGPQLNSCSPLPPLSALFNILPLGSG